MKAKDSEQAHGQISLSAAALRPEVMPAGISSSGLGTQRLRVLHIVSGDLWAGAEVQVFTLLKQLRASVDLHVLIMNEGELAERCRAMAIPLTLLDESRLSSFQLLKAMRRCMMCFQPDLVHTHRQKENVFGSIANVLGPRAACVRTVHGAAEFLPNTRQKAQRLVDKLCGRYLQHAVIAVSRDLRDKLLTEFPERHLRLIYNGIDPEEVRWDAQPPLRFSPGVDIFHVGLVGRLEAVKRIDIFLNMAALLVKRDADKWCFHIFGDGSQAAAMKRLARDLGIWKQLRFHGHARQIRRAIAGLDALVMPSDHEGLPMTALEAIALGVRLIAHDTGGLSELLAEHKYFLVSDHSAEGYAAALEAAFAFPPPLELKSEYLASTNGKRMLELYQNLSRGLTTA